MLVKRFFFCYKSRGHLCFKNFGEKWHSDEQNSIGDPLVSSLLLQVYKIFDLVRGSNTRTPAASRTSSLRNPKSTLDQVLFRRYQILY